MDLDILYANYGHSLQEVTGKGTMSRLVYVHYMQPLIDDIYRPCNLCDK